MNELNTKLNDCQDKLKQKINEAEILQNELTQLKEFRKRKVQMQKELEDVSLFLKFPPFFISPYNQVEHSSFESVSD
jgi:hypothetical protein